MKWMGTIGAGVLFLAVILWSVGSAQEPEKNVWQVWERQKREAQDRVCGVPEAILERQVLARVRPPAIEEVISIALEAARAEAASLIDRGFHTGRRLCVPEDFKTIQGAIDEAKSGDVVVVKPGTYFELIVMKDGVKLVSDGSDGGDEDAPVEGARLELPRRALRTIIDGSRAIPSNRGMIDFNVGAGRHTIVDGFTVQNLPKQNHHVSDHAHAVNIRGASPVITNCYVRDNGSTGIGSHVAFQDQEKRMPERDFRWANVSHPAEGVIYHNIVTANMGLGIGCNHLSAPFVLGNEVFSNSDAQLGDEPSPGVGVQHGAAARIVGNIIHDNPGGGILSKPGKDEGARPIDRPTHPTLFKNVVFQNGVGRPAISARGSGSKDAPVRFVGNFIYDAGAVGIGFSEGAVGMIEDNLISGSGGPGIEVSHAMALTLNDNRISGANGPGVLISNDAEVAEMAGNVADGNRGPRFMLRGATIRVPRR
jgi:hypothetical protein